MKDWRHMTPHDFDPVAPAPVLFDLDPSDVPTEHPTLFEEE